MSGTVWVLFPSLGVSTITIPPSHTCAHLVPEVGETVRLNLTFQEPVSSVFRVFEAVNTKHTGGIQPTVSARVGWFPHFEHLQFDDEAQQELFVKKYLATLCRWTVEG